MLQRTRLLVYIYFVNLSYRSSVTFMSNSISPFCAWGLRHHFYLSR